MKYTYYPAATSTFPNKQGINRITWNDNDIPIPEGFTEDCDPDAPVEWGWKEHTREYFETDPRVSQPVNLTDDQFEALLTPGRIERLKQLLNQNP